LNDIHPFSFSHLLLLLVAQNGFDNSGQALRRPTCFNWYNSTENVDRTVRIITKIAQQIRDDGLSDVVTGLGLLNEPFEDCDFNILGDYYNRGLAKVRSILGNSIKVYISDMFHSDLWNNVGFWQGKEYQNTFLDSHAYHGECGVSIAVMWITPGFQPTPNPSSPSLFGDPSLTQPSPTHCIRVSQTVL
jgi:hypothetical protein